MRNLPEEVLGLKYAYPIHPRNEMTSIVMKTETTTDPVWTVSTEIEKWKFLDEGFNINRPVWES